MPEELLTNLGPWFADEEDEDEDPESNDEDKAGRDDEVDPTEKKEW